MAESSNARMMVAGGLGLGLLLLVGLFVVGSGGDGAGEQDDAAGQDGGPEDPPNGAGDGGVDPEGAEGAAAAGAGADDAVDSPEADEKAVTLAGDGTKGPVGALSAIGMRTTVIEAPSGSIPLISPRFSPSGKWILAQGGKQAGTLWVAQTDEVNAGWLPIVGESALSEPTWVGEDEIAVVMGEQLYIATPSGRLTPALDPVDEPGRVMQPAGSPDGTKVAYVSITQTNHGGDIRLLNRETEVVTDVTASGARVVQPAWRKDGKALAGTVDGQVTAWALDASAPIARHPRPVPGLVPGWWGDRLQWQEGSLAVNLVVAEPDEAPRILARKALGSMSRPAPVAGGHIWLASLTDPGTLWAVRPDGSGVLVDTDAAYASQPDAVKRADGLWLAFTSNDKDVGLTRIHVGRVDPERLKP